MLEHRSVKNGEEEKIRRKGCRNPRKDSFSPQDGSHACQQSGVGVTIVGGLQGFSRPKLPAKNSHLPLLHQSTPIGIKIVLALRATDATTEQLLRSVFPKLASWA